MPKNNQIVLEIQYATHRKPTTLGTAVSVNTAVIGAQVSAPSITRIGFR